jgi:hypothetical protein
VINIKDVFDIYQSSYKKKDLNLQSNFTTMKVDNEMMEKVKILLAEELAAIELYIMHIEICENCRYTLMSDVIKKQAIKEMANTQKLIKQMLANEGISISEDEFLTFQNLGIEQQNELFCPIEAGP